MARFIAEESSLTKGFMAGCDAIKEVAKIREQLEKEEGNEEEE